VWSSEWDEQPLSPWFCENLRFSQRWDPQIWPWVAVSAFATWTLQDEATALPETSLIAQFQSCSWSVSFLRTLLHRFATGIILANRYGVDGLTNETRAGKPTARGIILLARGGRWCSCFFFFLLSLFCEQYIYTPYIQGVPLATELSISLTILPLMRILQRNLKRTNLIV